MPQKIKEEERIERIIRVLLKLPDNRRCINCNSLGPQYVCTTLWTFVCTNCSGVHREFTHRVKSVSIAKFTADEIAALQAGGNERAKQIYFKTWDPQRNPYPDSCNLHALRSFIKHVYLDRKFTGERKNGYPSVDKAAAKEDYSEKFRQKPREDFFERRYAERSDLHEQPSFRKSGPSTLTGTKSLSYYFEDRGSPQAKQENSRSLSHRRSRAATATFEIVDNRFRDHESGSARQCGSHRFADLESRARSSSPVSEKSNHPRLFALKDILGSNTPQLQVGEPMKEKDGSKTTSSKDEGSSSGREEEKKVVIHSLIDFDADFEPVTIKDSGPTLQTALSVPAGIGSDLFRNDKAANNLNINPMDSFLLELSGPVPAPSPAESTSNAAMSSNVIGTSNATLQIVPAFPDNNTTSKADTKQFPAMEQNRLFESSFENNNSMSPQTTYPIEAAYNQTSTSEQVPRQSPHPATDIVLVNSSGQGSVSGGMKELPMDLFTSLPSSFGGGAPSWQFSPPYGVGYNTQNNPGAMVPQDAFKSRNPFDLGDSGPQQEPTRLPFMPGPLASQSQYAPPILPHGNPYGMMATPAAYMGQQPPTSTVLSRPQGLQDSSNSNDAFASLNPVRHSSGAFSTQVQENPSSNPALAPTIPYTPTHGNPFG